MVGGACLLSQKDPCIRARGRSSRGCWLESLTDLSLTQSGCGPWRACPEAGKAARPSDKCGSGSVAEQQQPHHDPKCPGAAAHPHICTCLPSFCIATFCTIAITMHCTTIHTCEYLIMEDFVKENWTFRSWMFLQIESS